jgi:hypothetical protein
MGHFFENITFMYHHISKGMVSGVWLCSLFVCSHVDDVADFLYCSYDHQRCRRMALSIIKLN